MISVTSVYGIIEIDTMMPCNGQPTTAFRVASGSTSRLSVARKLIEKTKEEKKWASPIKLVGCSGLLLSYLPALLVASPSHFPISSATLTIPDILLQLNHDPHLVFPDLPKKISTWFLNEPSCVFFFSIAAPT